MIESLGEEFGGDLPDVDYPIGPEASDEQLSWALLLSGMFLLIGLALNPPLKTQKTRGESRALRSALTSRPDERLAAARFLTHALIDVNVTYAQVGSEIAHRLDAAPPPPAPVELRAQHALREQMPIADGDQAVIESANDNMRRANEIAADPELDAQGAFNFRFTEARLSTSIHGIRMLLGEKFGASKTARDNSGYSNLGGSVTIGYTWQPAEERMYETLNAVGSGN
jgi:hypothetical protein